MQALRSARWEYGKDNTLPDVGRTRMPLGRRERGHVFIQSNTKIQPPHGHPDFPMTREPVWPQVTNSKFNRVPARSAEASYQKLQEAVI